MKNTEEKQKLKLAKAEYKSIKQEHINIINEKSNIQNNIIYSFLDSEVVLEDSYLVYYSYMYIIDGVLRRSPCNGTIFDLKKYFNAKEIRSCDIIERFKND